MSQATIKKFSILFLFVLVFALSSRHASAQEAIQEPAQEQTPLFMPTSGWLVGDASAMPAQDGIDGGLPCVMANQYDNGFIVRISGGGGRVLAMAVDFRQSAFSRGSSYNVTLGVPPGLNKTVDAMAYNESTLVFNVSSIEGLYKALAKGREITLDIAGHAMSFALMNAGDGLRRVEECYYPNENRTPEAQQASAPEIPPVVQPSEPSPQAMNEIAPAAGEETPAHKPPAFVSTSYRLARAWASPDNAGEAVQSQPRDIIAPPVGEKAEAGENRWRALEGTSLREVLGAWAKQARMDLIWMPEGDFPVKQSAGLDGTFEEAVANLLGQYEGESQRPMGKIYNGPESGRKVLLIENGGTI